jgi:hypothetical protein
MSFNAPDIRQFKLTGSTVGDVHFPNVKLLMPFDGSNGATSTSDLSNKNNTSSFSGNAQISTAQSKFGGSSLAFDGTGDKITIGDSYWNDAISTGDFTIEYWLRINVQSTSQRTITNYSGGSNGWGMYYSSSNYLEFFWNHSSTFYYINNATGGAKSAIPNDTWTHVAVTRDGNNWRLFLNGTAENTRTGLAHTIVTSSQNQLTLGCRPDNSTQFLNGYIDDLRITVGEARYTSNFTAPTTAHLTSAGDANKQIIVNSSADGVDVGTGGISQARIAKAWVNFNGTSTVAIRSSYNVSSITDNGTGDYTANLSTALSDTNGAAVAMTGYVDHTWGIPLYKDVSGSNPLTTTQFRVATVEPETSSVTYFDQEQVSILIFGN